VTRAAIVLLTALIGLLSGASDAIAQRRSRDLFRPASVEIDVGGMWQGGVPLGSSNAPLTGNQGAPTVDLFNTSSDIKAYPGFEAKIGFHITRAFEVEGGIRYARPTLRTRISDDFENAPDVTADETFSQYTIDLNGVFHLNALRFGSSVPFIFGGGGYLRELHDGREVVETGQVFQAGFGIKQLLSRSSRGLIRGIGVRADARFCARRKAIELDEGEPVRTYAAASAALVVGF
jgi:hypothetical protein